MNIYTHAWTIVALIFVLVAAGAWWIFDNGNQVSAYEQLITTNESFAQGLQSAADGNYENAATSFNEALQEAKTTEQEGQILSRLATIKDLSGDHIGAITEFKKIAANAAYMPATRAYAVQYMGMMHHRESDSKIDEALAQAIFKESPYEAMWVPGDEALSYRHLFEYASSIYPIAYSDIMIADWYAAQLAVSTSTPETEVYKKIVDAKLESAEHYIAKNEQEDYLPGTSMVPISLTRIAVVKRRLAQAGLVSPEVAVTAFERALDSYKKHGYLPGADGFARYYYASYLSTLNPPRLPEIFNTLSPFFSNPSYLSSPIALYFKAGRMNSQGQKDTLQTLARLDASFKEYLVKLDWSERDF